MKKLAKRAKKQQNKKPLPSLETKKLPFIEHLHELRRRLFYIAASIFVFSAFAYSINKTIINILLKPAGTQKFIYTSPIGGVDFLFRVCLYVGIACSVPVIVYQFLRYVEPLFKQSSMHFITWGTIISGVLALAGILFGYFIGLPATLHFLLHQFFTTQIQPLLSIQSYMAFVSMYMLGSALLFQVPLILVFINRIKPLNPKKLISMKVERWVILGAFIGGGIMNPTPNIFDQLVIVVPLILTYQLGVGIIWYGQRKHKKPQYLSELLKKDGEVQTIRMERFQAAQVAWKKSNPEQPKTIAVPQVNNLNQAPTALPRATLSTSRTASRPRPYFNDFRPPANYSDSFNRQRLTGAA